MAVAIVEPLRDESFTSAQRLVGMVGLGSILLFWMWFAMGYIRDRVAPRVSIEGVGPYQRVREHVIAFTVGLFASAAMPFLVLVTSWLLSS